MELKFQVNRVLYIVLLFSGLILFSVSLPSCGESETNKISEYYCPMKCEGEKTYTVEGSCPVCGMDLKEKK